jgi:hypothetical protein
MNNPPRNINLNQQNRKINTEEKLVDYIKTMLGDGLITVDVSDKQIKLAIDDTVRKWADWAYSGQQHMVFTIEAKDTVNSYYLDERILAIYGISIADSNTNYGSGSGGGTSLGGFGQIGVNYIPYVNMEGQVSSLERGGAGFGNYSATGVAGGVAGGPATSGNPMEQMEIAYVQLVQSQMLNSMFGESVSFDFNPSNHILRIFEPIAGPILIEGALEYIPNPDHDDAYAHSWVKEYALNKVKLIWGQNVGKFTQNLIGGASINYDRLISEAQEALDRLDEDLLNKYSEALGIFSS